MDGTISHLINGSPLHIYMNVSIRIRISRQVVEVYGANFFSGYVKTL